MKYLQKNGKFPPVSISIFPLENSTITNGIFSYKEELYVDKFISYNFQSSIMVPVDSFQCEFYYEKVQGIAKPKDGDLVVLKANGIAIGTGIIDQVDIETDGVTGSKLTLQGRDLLSQFQDQDSVSLDSKILWGNKYTLKQIISALSKNTRINVANLIKRYAPEKPYLFATQPGESKLSSLQRHCESLDIYFWMDGSGNLIIGKPNMYGASKGSWYLNKKERLTNVISMRSTRNSTAIPNLIVPIWNGQEQVQNKITKSQFLENSSPGPARLLQYGHRTPKAVIVSTPEGATPQDLSEVNTLTIAGQNANQLNRAGASTILQVYAKREMARANLRDLCVQVSVPGHFNDLAEPLLVDSVYRIQYDIDDIDEDMFLYEVDYSMNENDGQRTRMFFCRQTALVANTVAL